MTEILCEHAEDSRLLDRAEDRMGWDITAGERGELREVALPEDAGEFFELVWGKRLEKHISISLNLDITWIGMVG